MINESLVLGSHSPWEVYVPRWNWWDDKTDYGIMYKKTVYLEIQFTTPATNELKSTTRIEKDIPDWKCSTFL